MKGNNAHQRWLILGASNVRRSLIPLIEQIFQVSKGPTDILFACGHGRSYCRPNRVLGWSLPGLSESGWQEAWRRHDQEVSSRSVILTDVGNDLLYGIEPDELLSHVELCLDALHPSDRIMLIGLPMDRLERVRSIEYQIFKKIFFPGSTIAFETVMRSAREVQQGLEALCRARQNEWLIPPSTWYGVDPIHIRRSLQRKAWGTVIQRLEASSETESSNAMIKLSAEAKPSMQRSPTWRLLHSLRLIFSRAQRQSWLDWTRDQSQPSLHLEDGSTVSLY